MAPTLGFPEIGSREWLNMCFEYVGDGMVPIYELVGGRYVQTGQRMGPALYERLRCLNHVNMIPEILSLSFSFDSHLPWLIGLVAQIHEYQKHLEWNWNDKWKYFML